MANHRANQLDAGDDLRYVMVSADRMRAYDAFMRDEVNRAIRVHRDSQAWLNTIVPIGPKSRTPFGPLTLNYYLMNQRAKNKRIHLVEDIKSLSAIQQLLANAMKENREGEGKGAMELLGRYIATVYLNASNKVSEKAVYRLPTVLPKVATSYNRKAELTIDKHDEYVTLGDVGQPNEDGGDSHSGDDLVRDNDDDFGEHNLDIVAEPLGSNDDDDDHGEVVVAPAPAPVATTKKPRIAKKKGKAGATREVAITTTTITKEPVSKKLVARKTKTSGQPSRPVVTNPTPPRTKRMQREVVEAVEAMEVSIGDCENDSSIGIMADGGDGDGDSVFDDDSAIDSSNEESDEADESDESEESVQRRVEKKREREPDTYDTYAMDALADNSFCNEFGIPTWGNSSLLSPNEMVKVLYSTHKAKRRKLSDTTPASGDEGLVPRPHSPAPPPKSVLDKSIVAKKGREPDFAAPSPRSLLRGLFPPGPSTPVVIAPTADAQANQPIGPFDFGTPFTQNGRPINRSTTKAFSRMASVLRAPRPPSPPPPK